MSCLVPGQLCCLEMEYWWIWCADLLCTSSLLQTFGNGECVCDVQFDEPGWQMMCTSAFSMPGRRLARLHTVLDPFCFLLRPGLWTARPTSSRRRNAASQRATLEAPEEARQPCEAILKTQDECSVVALLFCSSDCGRARAKYDRIHPSSSKTCRSA